MKSTIEKIRKRNGKIVPFEPDKIVTAIWKAVESVGGADKNRAEYLGELVVRQIEKEFGKGIPNVEKVQDIVEKTLIEERHAKTAKSYILYRKSHQDLREVKAIFDTIQVVEDYVGLKDWKIKENSNMGFSLQGLNNYIAEKIVKNYWLNRIYPEKIRRAHNNTDIHIHDLGTLGAYCVGWDLKDLLMQGFTGVSGKVQTKPAKHLRTVLGQLVNFFYTLQGETAGAQAFSNFDTLLAPFVSYDNLDYAQVKQCLQEFCFNMAVPTRVGFQTPFTNITMDLEVPNYMKEERVIIGGKFQERTYGEFQKEMNMINKAFAEVMMEGDAKGRLFTFPIPTYNITKDFNWENPEYDCIWEMTAKYGIPYFSNFVNSDMNPEDARSMCCRLRLNQTELRKRGGGLFGANPLTGSIGVVTMNLPKIAYESQNKEEFFNTLGNLMDLAKESLIIKRKALERFTEEGLYPYSKFYLRTIKNAFNEYWKNHFSTIGLLGMNEAVQNLFETENLLTEKGKDFAARVLDFMRDRLGKYQEETGEIFNLEATPAEGTTYRFAKHNKAKYKDMIVANEEAVKQGAEPYFTNSSQLPVDANIDLFKALENQDSLQTKYTGGCIEKGNKVLTDRGLIEIEKIMKNFKQLKPIKALSYNRKEKKSEWDEIVKAVKIDVKKNNKIRVIGERNLDITTSDWHPFFVLEKIKVDKYCPVCAKKISGVKGFAAHIKNSLKCRKKYNGLFKYHVIEKRADDLKKGDYILQNSSNLFMKKKTKLNDDLMWLVGFFIGDGCISKFTDNRGGNNLEKYKLRFSSEHENVLKKVAKILNKYFDCNVKVIKNDKRSNKLREVSVSKKKVVDFFFKYGFASGKKVYNVEIPLKIKKNLNATNMFSLLSGLMDSDGHIDKRDGGFEYYTVSPKLAENILEICTLAGIMISKSLKKVKRKNEKDIYRLRIPRYELTRIQNKLCNNVNILNVKSEISNRHKRHLPVVRVKEVSKVNVKDNIFYDLMTKKNHNYLAGKDSLVFIHNTVFHTFVGEKLDKNMVKLLVRKISDKFKLPYFTITPTFSICPIHGYIFGEQILCPKCKVEGKETNCEIYSRIVGYIRPINQWNLGKREEFKDRVKFKTINLSNQKVKLFKKPSCDQCKALYDKLKENKIDFEEEMLEEHMRELIEMARTQGIENFDTPVVVCNKKLYCNVNYEKFIELVNG